MSKEKIINDRIRYIEDDQDLKIEIKANIEKNKENILLAWLIIWIVIGVSMVYYLFTQEIPDDNMKIALYVFLGFWLYYLYKVFRSYRWLAHGREEIIVNDENLIVTNWVGKRGLPMTYALTDISKVRVRDVDIKSFQYQMENSFWVIGGDRLEFDHNSSPVFFGKRLDEKPARKVIRLINDKLKASKSKQNKSSE